MAKTKKEIQWYNVKNLLKHSGAFYLSLGLRSCGKSYSTKVELVEDFFRSGCLNKFCYIRRWKEDIKATAADSYFRDINADGVVTELAKKYNYKHIGETLEVHYLRGKFVLQGVYTNEETGEVSRRTIEEIGYALALNRADNYKSTSYEGTGTVVFEEFMSRKENYLGVDEAEDFIHLVSTIVRYRENVRIILLANTVSKLCPYFPYFKITAKDFKKGQIIRKELDDGRVLILEMVDDDKYGYSSSKYFGNDKSITTSEWDHEDYKIIDVPVSWKSAILGVEITVLGTTAYTYLKPLDNYFVIDCYDKRQKCAATVVYSTDEKYMKNMDMYHYYKFNFPPTDIFKLYMECLRNRRIRCSNDDAGEIVRQMLVMQSVKEY